MLVELSIENVVLVAKARLAFGPGLNILTGETGAGKSILLDALAMALGARVGSDLVRHGTDRARVDATFGTEDIPPEAREMLLSLGADLDEGILVLTRELDRGGRSTARLNGRVVTVALLREVAALLIDVHGQHEHQSLLDESKHIDLLDAWAGDEIQPLRFACKARAEHVRQLKSEQERLRADARDRARESEYLAHQIEEIDAAALSPDEETALVAERALLAEADRLEAAAESARAHLADRTIQELAKAVAALERIENVDPRVASLLEGARTAYFAADDTARSCRAYRDSIESNPERLAAIDERLDRIHSLQRKYGDSIESVLEYREDAAKRKEICDAGESRALELEIELYRETTALREACAALSRARGSSATPLAALIQAELSDLAMAGTRFEIDVEAGEPGPSGADRVCFRIAPNPGEPARPLARTASGGESSRLMLALKMVLARSQMLRTLVFDEVDAGIGGRTAVILGKKLRGLSRDVQVLCITHLAQVAASGSTHFRVEKTVVDSRTVLSIEQVEGDGRVDEIARMLAGDTGETARTHARELLANH